LRALRQINNLCEVEALLGNAEQRYFTVRPTNAVVNY
jgi:hypothetical protein